MSPLGYPIVTSDSPSLLSPFPKPISILGFCIFDSDTSTQSLRLETINALTPFSFCITTVVIHLFIKSDRGVTLYGGVRESFPDMETCD